jgi:hypothetical protein
MGNEPEELHDTWDACTWSGARRDVLNLSVRLSFREKILWLEEGARLSLAFKTAREQLQINPPGQERLSELTCREQ